MSLESHHLIHENPENADRFAIIHSKRSVKMIDKWVMAVGILAPLSSVPQILQIVTTHDSRGVSAVTWSLYILLAIFWLVYGIAHEEKPIIVTNVLWILFELIVVALIFVYR